MRTRSKAKEAVAPAKRRARKTGIKPDVVVEVQDDFQTCNQGQVAGSESSEMLEEKQDVAAPVTLSESPKQDQKTITDESLSSSIRDGGSEVVLEEEAVPQLKSPIRDQKTIGDEPLSSFIRGGGSEVALEEEAVPELKSEPNQEEVNNSLYFNTISESVCGVENNIGDSIVAVILNEESTVEVKVELAASVEHIIPVLQHDGTMDIAIGDTREDIQLSPEVRVGISVEAHETIRKEEEIAQVDKVMTEGCEPQVNEGIPEQTLNKTEEMVIDGDKIEREVDLGVDMEQPEHTESKVGKDEGKGVESEIKVDGEDTAKVLDENAEIREEFSDFQQSLPMLEWQRRKQLEVFVGEIETEATEDDIRDAFKVAGEVKEVRLMRNSQTGKNKGYAFVRYATVEEAKRAVSELDQVKVRGKSCGVLPSDENGTIFIGNINKSWKKEAVMEKLTGYGIENIEELTLIGDPQNEGLNRGFAFLESASHEDALKAFKRLQQPDAMFDEERSAKVAWAQPINAPDDEALAQGEVKVLLAKPQIKHKPSKGGVHGGFPVQMTGSKLTVGSGGVQGRGGVMSGLRGRRAVGLGRHMAQGLVGGRGILPQHQMLQHTMHMGRTQGGNARGAYSRHYELVHPSARNPWPVSTGAFRDTYAGRGGYAAVLPAGRQGVAHQDQPFSQAMGRNFHLGYNHGMAGPAGAVREYGVAVSGVKRSFSAMEDPRYADAAARHSRARIEPPARLGGFQYGAGPVHGNSASASLNHPPQLVARGGSGIPASYGQPPAGIYPSGSHVYNAAQSADYLGSVSEMRRKPSQPAAYRDSAGSAGYGIPGAGTRPYY